MDSERVRFFWVGEQSEIFAAHHIQDLATHDGRAAGSGIQRCEQRTLDDGFVLLSLFDEHGNRILWGELPGTTRELIRETDDDDRVTGTFTGSLFDIYEWDNGGRYGLPWMLMTQYAYPPEISAPLGVALCDAALLWPACVKH